MDLNEQHELIDRLGISDGWKKTFKENRRFNVWGLLFGWLYVAFLGMSSAAVFYFFMMFFPMIVLGTVFPDTGIGVLSGIGVMHIWIAFRVNGKYKQYVMKRKEIYLNVRPDAPVSYFFVSRKRFFFGSILTVGLYNLYWMYRNWKAIKDARKYPDISPLGNTFFWIFYLPGLLKTIKTDAVKTGFSGRFSVDWMFVLYTGAAIGTYYIERLNNISIFLEILWWLLIIVSPIILFPALQAIAVHNKAINQTAEPQTRPTFGEVLIFVIGGVLLGLTVLSTFATVKFSKKETVVTAYMVSSFFIEDLPTYCADNGYVMSTSYVQLVKEAFKRPALIDETIEQLPDAEKKVLAEEQNEMSRQVIMGFYQKGKRGNPRMTMADLCREIDKNAGTILLPVAREYRQLIKELP